MMNVPELIDDLKSALDQMNRNLSVIADQNKKQTELLEKMARKLGVDTKTD